MEELAAVPWEAIGLSGMAVLGVYLVLTGKIVPRSVLLDTQAERDSWRDQARVSDEIADKALSELGVLTRAAEQQAREKELSVALLQSVRGATTQHQEDS